MPRASFAPVALRCQCVLTSVATLPPTPASLRKAASSASLSAGGPLSTTTSPALVGRMTTLTPETRSTLSSGVTSTRSIVPGSAALWARTRGAKPNAASPPATPRSTSRRLACGLLETPSRTPSLLDARDLARAVADALHLEPSFVDDGEQQVRERRVLRQLEVLAAAELAVRAADQDVRQRIIVVPVAVAHVRAVHQQRVIEQ